MRIAAILDEDVEWLHHAGADPRGGQLVAAGDCRAIAGEVLQLRLVRVQLGAEADEYGHDHEAGGRDSDGVTEHEACPAPPGTVLWMTTVDEPPRHHPDAVDPLAEYREQRREQRQRHEHGDDGYQHPADPHRAEQGQWQDDHREQSDRYGRARDDHRVSCVSHRLDERRLDVASLTKLVAEAEDHQ